MFPLIPVAASALLPSATSALSAGIAFYFLLPDSAEAAMPIRQFTVSVSGKASSASSDLAVIEKGASNVDLSASGASETRGKGDGSPCSPIGGEIGCPPPPPPPPYQPPLKSTTSVPRSLTAKTPALSAAHTSADLKVAGSSSLAETQALTAAQTSAALTVAGNTLYSSSSAQSSSETQALTQAQTPVQTLALTPAQTSADLKVAVSSSLAETQALTPTPTIAQSPTSSALIVIPTSNLIAQNFSNSTSFFETQAPWTSAMLAESSSAFFTPLGTTQGALPTSALVLAGNTSGREFFVPTSGFTAAQNFSNATIFLGTSALWSPDGNAIQISNASFPNNQTNTSALSTTGNPMVSNSNITFIQYTNVSDIDQILKNQSLVLLDQNSSSLKNESQQIISYSGIESDSDDSKKYIIIGSSVGGAIMLGGAAVLAWKYCRQRAPANPQQPQQNHEAIIVVNYQNPGNNPNNANAQQILAAMNGQVLA
jgi:hypothetical protein